MEIASVLQAGNLLSQDHAFLKRWMADPRAADIGVKIAAAMQKKWEIAAGGFRKIFIYEVLAALAGHATDSKAFLKQADNAASLARFLRGPDPRRYPAVLPKSDYLIAALEDAAGTLRTLAANQKSSGLKQVSRMDRSGSRTRVIFMQSVSDLLMAFCGQFLDEAGMFLTDIAFPAQETTLEQIRSARRPTTRSGRRKLAE